MPATNGRRAVAANQPATAPNALSETSTARIGTSHGTPALPAIACIACMKPCSPDTCSFGSASNTHSVRDDVDAS